jgi:hypothetical protein
MNLVLVGLSQFLAHKAGQVQDGFKLFGFMSWLAKGLSIEDQCLWKTNESFFLDTSVLLALGAFYATLFII